MRNKLTRLSISAMVITFALSSSAGSFERRAPDYPDRSYSPSGSQPIEREAKDAQKALDMANAQSDKDMASLSRDMQPGGGRSLSTARKLHKMALSYRKQGDMEKACFYAEAAYAAVSGIPGMEGSPTELKYAETAEAFCTASA